jgi:hypothetical protein
VKHLEQLARRVTEAYRDPAARDWQRSLQEFLAVYRRSDLVEAQYLDPDDAERVERGAPERGRPVQFSTKELDAARPSGPWVASSGRWLVWKRGDHDWLLERYLGGTWERTSSGWRLADSPLVRLSLGPFDRNWDGLAHAVRVDLHEGLWPRTDAAATEFAAVVERLSRLGPPTDRYLRPAVPRLVRVRFDDGDEDVFALEVANDEVPEDATIIRSDTPMYLALAAGRVGEAVEVPGPQGSYVVTITDVEALS